MDLLKTNYSFTHHYTLAHYDNGAYGAGAYGQGEQQQSADHNHSSAGNTGTNDIINNLASTGWDVLLPIILGLSLIGAGIILLLKRWLRRRKQSQPV